MLVLDTGSGALADRTVRDLPGYLAPGDLLVLNDTRVVAARVFGHEALRRPRRDPARARARRQRGAGAAAASKPIRDGLEIEHRRRAWCGSCGARASCGASHCRSRRSSSSSSVGEVPLPPYIRRPAARRRSRALPEHLRARAGRGGRAHRQPALRRGAGRGPRGARRAARARDAARRRGHLPAGARRGSRDAHVCTPNAPRSSDGGLRGHRGGARARRPRRRGRHDGRCARWSRRRSPAAQHGALAPWAGDTRLFITPGFRFRVVDALLTNFHLPESTLLMLVCAFAGRERVLAAYAHAVARATASSATAMPC